MPEELGGAQIFVSPDVALKYWRLSLGAADEGLFGLANEMVQPGDRVWDIGASIGLFSVAAAWRAGREGRILAVEPDSWVAGLLRRSSERLPSGYAALEVEELACADRSEKGELVIATRGRAASHLAGVAGSTQAGSPRQRQAVRVAPLDEILETHFSPNLVKIDVEGSESLVVKSGQRLWRDDRPVALCEVSAANAEFLSNHFKRHDYQIFNAETPRQRRSPLETAPWNCLLVPRESPRRPSLVRDGV